MKKTEFLKMVELEALHLRDNATDKEKSNLDFNTFDPRDYTLCIYGQMTGSCDSIRADELYNKIFSDITDHGGGTFSKWIGSSNSSRNVESKSVTPIEVYVSLTGSKNKSLLQYIKGEIKTFKA